MAQGIAVMFRASLLALAGLLTFAAGTAAAQTPPCRAGRLFTPTLGVDFVIRDSPSGPVGLGEAHVLMAEPSRLPPRPGDTAPAVGPWLTLSIPGPAVDRFANTPSDLSWQPLRIYVRTPRAMITLRHGETRLANTLDPGQGVQLEPEARFQAVADRLIAIERRQEELTRLRAAETDALRRSILLGETTGLIRETHDIGMDVNRERRWAIRRALTGGQPVRYEYLGELIPISGVYTLNPADMAQVATQLKQTADWVTAQHAAGRCAPVR